MNVVYLVQAGDHGPVKIGTTTHQRLARRMAEGQCWNPQPLVLRILLAGDETLEQRLRAAMRAWSISEEWFTADVLEHVPDDLHRLPFDDGAERAKLAARRLVELSRSRQERPA